MDKRTRNIGLITLAAGALAYPAWLLYKYVAGRMNRGTEEHHIHKAFAPTYRGKNRKHRQSRVESDGQLSGGLA